MSDIRYEVHQAQGARLAEDLARIAVGIIESVGDVQRHPVDHIKLHAALREEVGQP